MDEPRPLAVAIVCEARKDRDTASGLADRVLCDHLAGVTASRLDHVRTWRGLHPNELHLEWRHVRRFAAERDIRAHGHFSGEPGAPDAHAARKALLLLHGSSDRPDAVVLVRDSDGQEERRNGLEQARNSYHWSFTIVIRVAHPKRECWVLAGFEPENEPERRKLTELRSELRFDPRTHAHKLTARGSDARTNAKRVLERLTNGDAHREKR